MRTHKTGTPQEWLAARIELLQAEKDLARRNETGLWWRRHDEYGTA